MRVKLLTTRSCGELLCALQFIARTIVAHDFVGELWSYWLTRALGHLAKASSICHQGILLPGFSAAFCFEPALLSRDPEKGGQMWHLKVENTPGVAVFEHFVRESQLHLVRVHRLAPFGSNTFVDALHNAVTTIALHEVVPMVRFR